MNKTKPFYIPKEVFLQAYRLVKANAGAAGVDGESLKVFEEDLKNNLYKLWNRMSSGSYFPPPVKGVEIPKKSGGVRLLGVPTVSDRIAQMVVKMHFEPKVEPYFLPDSYGYRPNKSALDAIKVTRERCWKYDWVLEFDIKGLFDNIPWDLLMKAVRKHTDKQWILLYIERWLQAPMQKADGTITARSCGTPQGGVISPILSNLFLHYVFDKWMQIHYPNTPWCRYADDGLAHCRTETEARKLLEELRQRFKDCGLELHPNKTKIVYCKDVDRKEEFSEISFDFLGYTFKPRLVRNSKRNRLFVSFTPAASKTALKAMRQKVRELNVRNRTDLSLEDLARWLNPILNGWLNYYGRYRRSELYSVWRHFNKTLVAWAARKYKRFRQRKTWAAKHLQKIAENESGLFIHWRNGMQGAFA